MTENKEKIVIHGVPPKWSAVEFENRVTGWVNVYHNTIECMELVRSPLPHGFLQLVIEKAKEGFAIAANQPVRHEQLDHSCYMVKPESMQVDDIAAIRAKVKAEYIGWLEDERSRYQDLLRQQLKQSAADKEEKAQREKEAKQLAEIEKQVQACFTPLEIPE